MFSCYTHGWSSALSMCPLCWNQQISITTSTGTFESIVSGKEIERLRSENARLREALWDIAQHHAPYDDNHNLEGQCCDGCVAKAALEWK